MIIPEIHLIFDLILFNFTFNFHLGTTPGGRRVAALPVQSPEVEERHQDAERALRRLELYGAGRSLLPGCAGRELPLEERRALPQDKGVELEALALHDDGDVRVLPGLQELLLRRAEQHHTSLQPSSLEPIWLSICAKMHGSPQKSTLRSKTFGLVFCRS